LDLHSLANNTYSTNIRQQRFLSRDDILWCHIDTGNLSSRLSVTPRHCGKKAKYIVTNFHHLLAQPTYSVSICITCSHKACLRVGDNTIVAYHHCLWLCCFGR